jgi:hypothetical protein
MATTTKASTTSTSTKTKTNPLPLSIISAATTTSQAQTQEQEQLTRLERKITIATESFLSFLIKKLRSLADNNKDEVAAKIKENKDRITEKIILLWIEAIQLYYFL